MAQRILGGNSPAKGMCDEIEWPLDIQAIQHQFQVIYQAVHRTRQLFRIIAQAVSTHVRRDHTHRLPKEAQLVKPLRGTPSIPMHQDECSAGIIGIDIDDTYAAQTLLALPNGYVNSSPVEFNVQCHAFLPLSG